MILNESKRDDLLLPCLEILKSKGVNTTLGELKRFLLRKFVEEGDMRNLSLGSNFYLAGVARYYFNGDLTFNKDLSIFKPNPMEADNWNKEVCKKLNALILILRNSVVDSVGETFEQPEDFGTLTIAKLLKKYNKKILKELGEEPVEDNTPVVDNLDRSTAVGNDYTFEILYTAQDAVKYYEPTKPGAWCITYNSRYFKHYTGLNGGCHFVIFKKNGWENVKRQKGPEWNSKKPQDEYGNSLIAFLQQNSNGAPHYITSRWNHGQGSDNSICEADYAYTYEEFKQKTGVTDADMARIQSIWEMDNSKNKNKEDNKKERKELKERLLKSLRHLKYAQMRINGGENPDTAIISIPREVDDKAAYIDKNKRTIAGNGKVNKSITVYKFSVEEKNYVVLVDKGKIIFETLIPFEDFRSNYRATFNYTDIVNDSGRRVSNYYWIKNAVVIAYPNETFSIYDLRSRQMVNVEGTTKFKYFHNMSSNYTDEGNVIFYEVSLSNKQFALINAKTNQPLVLPNGMCWYEKMSCVGKPTYYSRSVHPFIVKSGVEHICITYEAVSNTKYLYNVNDKSFKELNEIQLQSENDYIRIQKLEDVPDVYRLHNVSHMNGTEILIKDNTKISIGPYSVFSKINMVNDFHRLFIYKNNQYTDYGKKKTESVLWSYENMSFFMDENGEPLKVNWITQPYYSTLMYLTPMDIAYSDNKFYDFYIFDKIANKFLVNPSTKNIVFKLTEKMRRECQSWDESSRKNVIKALDKNGNEVSYRVSDLIEQGYVQDPFKPGSAPLLVVNENENNTNAEPALATVNEMHKITYNDIQQMVMEAVNRLMDELK